VTGEICMGLEQVVIDNNLLLTTNGESISILCSCMGRHFKHCYVSSRKKWIVGWTVSQMTKMWAKYVFVNFIKQ